MLILYADDNTEDFNFIRDVVHGIDSKIDCIHARDGAEALDWLMKLETVPDIILLNVQLSEIDYMTCLKVIRQVSALRHVSTVVCDTEPWDAAQCQEFGLSDSIQKPMNRNRIAHQLTRILNKRKQDH